MRSVLQRKLSRGSNLSEDEEARDQLGGLGRNASQYGAQPGRPPLGPGSRRRSTGYGGNSSNGGSSTGTRSMGGSSAGSGGGTRSLGDGSEATSVDFNQGAGGDTQLAFGQLAPWPGDYVKAAFKGSSHWARPRELIPEIMGQVGRGSGSALPSSGMRGNKVNLGGLLTSLRELSAHVSGGYGWPACADRVAPLCGSLHQLLGELKARGGDATTAHAVSSKLLFGNNDASAEKKVVRLAYAHLSAAAASDSAIRRREDRLRATGRATAPFSITFVSSSSSSSSSSSTNSPANNNNNSPRGRVGDGSGRLLGASSANYNGSSSGGGFGGAQSRGMAFGGSASSRGYGRSGGGAEGRALPEDLLQRALSSAEAELLMLDHLPRRCLAAHMYAALAVLAAPDPGSYRTGSSNGDGSSMSHTGGGSNGSGGSSSIPLEVSLKQLPLLLAGATTPSLLNTPSKGSRLKQRKAAEENQVLLASLCSAARQWVQHVAEQRENDVIAEFARREALFHHAKSGHGSSSSSSNGASANIFGSGSAEWPAELLLPLVAAATADTATPQTARAALGALALLSSYAPLVPRLSAALAPFLTPLVASLPADKLLALTATTNNNNNGYSRHNASSSSSRSNGNNDKSSSSSSGSNSSSDSGGGALAAAASDVLASISFLRCCAAIAQAPLAAWSPHSGPRAEAGAAQRTAAYAVLCAGLVDPRARVQLEAMHLLLRPQQCAHAWWRMLEAAASPPPANTVVALTDDDLRGLVARAGGATAAFTLPPPSSQSQQQQQQQAQPQPPRRRGSQGGTVAGSAAGRAAVQSALGLLQGAVQRGGGASGGLGSDALSLTPLPRAAESLVSLLTLALSPPRASSSDPNATNSSHSEHDDTSTSRSRRYSHSSNGGDSSSGTSALPDSSRDRNNHSSSSSTSTTRGNSSSEGWDRAGMDSALASAGCRAAADLGRCVQSRLDPHVLTAYGRGSQLPATDAPDSTASSSSSLSSPGDRALGGGLLLGGGQQSNSSASSAALPFASDVPLRAAPSWAPPPPPPVGFTDLRTNTIGGNCDGRDPGEGASNTSPAQHAPSLDLSPGLLHVPGSPWAVEESCEVVTNAVTSSQVAAEQVAELLLFGVVESTTGGGGGGGLSDAPSATGTGFDRPMGGTRATGASLSSSSSSTSTAPWPRWGPLLSARAPWRLQLRCLEALIWLAHDASARPAWWRHMESTATAAAADAATTPPGRRHHGSSRISTSTGRTISSVGRNGLIGARTPHSFPPPLQWLWRALRAVLLQAGTRLPIEARVELIDALAARVATDGRAIGLALPEHCTTGALSEGANTAAGSHEGAGLSVRLALQVGVAWLKHEPSEALGEALRRLWAAATTATATASTNSTNPTSAACTEEQRSPQATSAQEGADDDGYDSTAKLRWQLAGRRALLESLYDVLDWRVVSSRPDAATTDSSLSSLHDLESAESDRGDTSKGTSTAATTAAAAAAANAHAHAQAAEVSWAGGGGEPSFTAAWAVSARLKRVAISALVDLAVHEAATAAGADFNASAKANMGRAATESTNSGNATSGESRSLNVACDATFVTSHEGDKCDRNSVTADESSSKGDDHGSISRNTANESTDSAIAWVYGSLGSSLVARLQAGALTGELSHRRACIRGLARLALAWPDPARFSLYAFLHQAHIDTAHLSGAHASTSASSDQTNDEEEHRKSVQDLSDDMRGGAAEGMGVEDLVAPALLLLDCEYAAKDFAHFGTPIPLELDLPPGDREKLHALLN